MANGTLFDTSSTGSGTLRLTGAVIKCDTTAETN
jgi:hypothetical protein